MKNKKISTLSRAEQAEMAMELGIPTDQLFEMLIMPTLSDGNEATDESFNGSTNSLVF